MGYEENKIEGRNAVLEAFRSGKTIDKLFVLDGCQDGPIKSITREARKGDTIINYVNKDRLDQISETGKHQGVIAISAAYDYAEVEDILAEAKQRGEDDFIVALDGVEDPHNLGSILRVCECAGVHGVIIAKNRAVGVNETVIKTSAGATQHVKVARVTNLNNTIADLKKAGLWIYAADMDGQDIYASDLRGRVCLVVGGEGKGVSRLLKENCDGVVSLKLKGKINSLNASVACGIVVYEALRQRG